MRRSSTRFPNYFGRGSGLRKQLQQRGDNENLAELDTQLATQKLCQRLALQAGWYAVLRVPAIWSDEELAISLLEMDGSCPPSAIFTIFRADGYLSSKSHNPTDVFSEGIGLLLEAL